MSFFTFIGLAFVAGGIWPAARLVSWHARVRWSGAGAHRSRPDQDQSIGPHDLLLAASLATTGLVILTVPGQLRWVIVMIVSGVSLVTMLIWAAGPWIMRRWRRRAGDAASGARPA